MSPRPDPPSTLRRIESAFRRRLRDPVLLRLRGYRFRAMPIAMITGTEGKTTTTRLLASILEKAGHTVGVATTDSVTVGGETLRMGDLAGKHGHGLALSDSRVTAAALETARGGLRTFGLYLRPVMASALLNVGNDHVGIEGIGTIDEMARHKRKVTDAARHAVLNADDPRCLAIAGRYRPARVTLFSLDPGHPALGPHLEAGGRAVVAGDDGRAMLLERGKAPLPLVDLAEVPVTHGGAAEFFVSDALAAAALALALGADAAAVSAGLRAFEAGAAGNPARLTFLDGYPCTVLVDRAHEASTFSTVADFAARVASPGPRVAVVTGYGNRLDAHFRAFGRAVAARYDHVIVCEIDRLRRGRPAGEVAARIAEGILQGGLGADRVETVLPLDDAVARAAGLVMSGGLLHVSCETGDPAGLVERAFAAAAKSPSAPAGHGNPG